MFRVSSKNTFIVVEDVAEEFDGLPVSGASVRSRSVDAVVHASRDECLTRDVGVDLQMQRLDMGIQKGPTIFSTTSLQLPANVVEEKTFGSMSKLKTVASNSSVSTMAPDDVSDFGDSGAGCKGLGFRRELSLLSLCSLASEGDEDEIHQAGVGSALQAAEKAVAPERQSRVPTEDFSHCHVPKSVNLAKQFAALSGLAALPTTIMIRNIPNRYSQQQIMKELESLGFADTFDFFYAPMDKLTKCTVGYAFVNFVTPDIAASCMQVMAQHRFQSHGRQREKQARVSVAHLQGLEANIKHYQNAAVTGSNTDRQAGPIIKPSISRCLLAA